MAPLAVITLAVTEIINGKRGLGSTVVEDAHRLKDSQENTLQCLALVFSTFSVASAILAFYWFMKMRRSFRHDLVMLLIQSDMFKALWLMLYPIVTFANGPINSASKTCQFNGFFLAVGIEASDIAVLMIAIHSALCIFKPRIASGEGGLYPYRKVAYTVWIIYPLTMASLGFVKGNSYVSDGTYCYLPVRPFWYRLALAWIPRYLIFMVILGIYASIYLYVRAKFRGFTELEQARTDDSTEGSQQQESLPKRVLPKMPPLALKGPIQSSRQNSTAMSVSTMETIQSSPLSTTGGAHHFIWSNLISVSPPSPTNEIAPDLMVANVALSEQPSSPRPFSPMTIISLPPTPHSIFSSAASPPLHTREATWDDPYVARVSPTPGSPATVRSIVDIFTVIENEPGQTEVVTPIHRLRLTNSRGQNFAVAEMLATRDKIRRQLRFLFIYPLVYIGMWVLPFVLHVLQYRQEFTQSPPFILMCLTTICVASQAAVDCWLFSTREKPWRHIPGNNKSFFGSLKFWSGWKGVTKRGVKNGPGKTRDEMFREARAAYHRRDEEIAQQRNESVNLGNAADARKERSWWEASGLDPMSPVMERDNPLDDVTATKTTQAQDANALKIHIIPERSQEDNDS